jgi:hypothetical protein
VSTFVAALAGLCAFYLLLRELTVARRAALLGVAVLGMNPVFLMLAFTYMSDVPFLTLMLWTSFAVARAFNTERRGWFVGAVVFASLSMGTREISVAIPVALALAVLLWSRHRQDWTQVLVRVGLCLVPLAVFGGLMWWQRHAVFVSVELAPAQEAPNRLSLVKSGVLLVPQLLGWGTVSSMGTVGLALLPLSLGMLAADDRPRRGWWALATGLVVGAIVAGATTFHPPLSPKSLWAAQELGFTQSMVPYYQPPNLPVWWRWVMFPLCCGSSAVVLAGLLRRTDRAADVYLGFLVLGQFCLLVILWLFHDRYELVLVPLLGALVLARHPPLNRPAVVAGVLVFAVVAGVGLRDHLRFNHALWQAVAELRRLGATDREIDGGYVVTGSLQYANPEHAPRDADGWQFISGMTTRYGKLRYQIAVRPLPDLRPLGQIPYHLSLSGTGVIYLYDRGAVTGQPTR